jgi:tetratricopeptide (TPR) repeat protein
MTTPSARQSSDHARQKPQRRIRATLLIAALLGIAGFAAYSFGRQIYAEREYQAALRALAAGVSSQTQEHLEQAKARLALCLKVRPDSLDANFLAARTSRRLQAYDDAAMYLRRYEKLDGVPEAVKLEAALAAVQRGDFSTEGYLQACAKQEHPDRILILEALTRGYMLTYQIPRAVECLNRWLDTQPNALQALLWRGQLLRVLGHFQPAATDYAEALKLDPDCDEARLNLAEILIHEHRARDAVPHFEIVSERQPGNVAAVFGLGRCKAELGEPEEARKLFDRLLSGSPDNPLILAESGKIFLNAGQLTDAEARLRASLRLAPNERETLFSMYKCLEQLGKKDEADRYLREYNRVDKEQEQLRNIMQQIMQKPKDSALRCQAAQIYLRNGLLKEARLWLEDATRADPRYAATYLLLAEYWERVGNAAKAVEYRRRAGQAGKER